MLFSGKTADLFGRKRQLILGMGSLSLFSLGTAFTTNPLVMNVLCGFLGLATAIISPPAIGTLFATYPAGKRQNLAAGALGSGNPVGFIFGSISSGLVTKYYSWRASFIVISIFFVIMTALAIWTMPSIPRSGNVKTELKRFDWLGTFLTITGLALFCAALT
jgi:MFS family permease